MMISALQLTQRQLGPVELWWGDVMALAAHQDFFYSVLDATEQKAAQRFVTDTLALRYIIAHGVLRLLLAHYLQCAPLDIALQRGPHGKPYIPDTNLSFNLSHAQDSFLLGFSWQCAVGVDIEYIPRDNLDPLNIAERYFHPHEHAFLTALPKDQQTLAFYRLWTEKEALLKAMGIGIAHHLATCEMQMDPTLPPRLLSFEGKDLLATQWTLYRIEPMPGYIAALAHPVS